MQKFSTRFKVQFSLLLGVLIGIGIMSIIPSKVVETPIFIDRIESRYITQEKTIHEIASEVYNVPKELIIAIERLETGNYESSVYKNLNNTWGCVDNNTKDYCKYDNVKQSTLSLARNLSFEYGVKGNNYNLDEIGKIYCPNDDTWASKVRNIMKEVKNDYI